MLTSTPYWHKTCFLVPQKVKDPEKAAELRAQLQRVDQQLTADRAAQRKAQLVSGIKVRSSATPGAHVW